MQSMKLSVNAMARLTFIPTIRDLGLRARLLTAGVFKKAMSTHFVHTIVTRPSLGVESSKLLRLLDQRGSFDLSLPLREIRKQIEEDSIKFRGTFNYSGNKEHLAIPYTKDSTTKKSQNILTTVLRPQSESRVYNNLMLYFHGGGWVWGSRATHMAFCEMISEICSCVVVNVEYRLAPENKFPACYEDAERAVSWCLKNRESLTGNSNTILGVAGDSAGGNIAASICHMTKGIDYQILIYPVLTLKPDTLYSSTVKYGEGFYLTNELMKWFRDHFLSSKDDIYAALASPMKQDHFTNLPPALFVVAEHDPLADHSTEYQLRLDNAGVRTKLVLLKDVIHGFVEKPGWFRETNRVTIDCIKEFFSTQLE